MPQEVLSVTSASQVNLQGGINRNDIVILRDDGGVVHVIYRIAFHRRIVMQKLVGSVLPHRKGEHGFAFIHLLSTIIDDPTLY